MYLHALNSEFINSRSDASNLVPLALVDGTLVSSDEGPVGLLLGLTLAVLHDQSVALAEKVDLVLKGME